MNACYGDRSQRPALPAPETPQLGYAMRLAAVTMNRIAMPIYLPDADHDDFFSIARIAAWQALVSYNPARGADWRSWVISNVRWALAEEARRLDPLTRKQRREENDKAKIREAALANGEPPPPDTEPWLPVPVSLDAMLGMREGPHHEESEEGIYYDKSHLAGLVDPWDWEAILNRTMIQTACQVLEPRLKAVIDRRLKGATLAEIAKEQGISESRAVQLLQAAVADLQAILGLAPRSPLEEREAAKQAQNEALLDRFEAGEPVSEIAGALGLTTQAVQRRLTAMKAERQSGVAHRPAGPVRPAVVALTKEGYVPREIAARLKITLDSVYTHQAKARRAGQLPPREGGRLPCL